MKAPQTAKPLPAPQIIPSAPVLPKLDASARRLTLLSWWRSPMVWLALSFIGLVIWRAANAATLGQFVVSLVLWSAGIGLAYWVVSMWRIVFSLRLSE